MQVRQIEDVQDVINELESVATERIKAETRLEKEMENLAGLKCDSLKEAEVTLKKLDATISKREDSLAEEFEDFMEDYGSLF